MKQDREPNETRRSKVDSQHATDKHRDNGDTHHEEQQPLARSSGSRIGARTKLPTLSLSHLGESADAAQRADQVVSLAQQRELFVDIVESTRSIFKHCKEIHALILSRFPDVFIESSSESSAVAPTNSSTSISTSASTSAPVPATSSATAAELGVVGNCGAVQVLRGEQGVRSSPPSMPSPTAARQSTAESTHRNEAGADDSLLEGSTSSSSYVLTPQSKKEVTALCKQALTGVGTLVEKVRAYSHWQGRAHSSTNAYDSTAGVGSDVDSLAQGAVDGLHPQAHERNVVGSAIQVLSASGTTSDSLSTTFVSSAATTTITATTAIAATAETAQGVSPMNATTISTDSSSSSSSSSTILTTIDAATTTDSNAQLSLQLGAAGVGMVLVTQKLGESVADLVVVAVALRRRCKQNPSAAKDALKRMPQIWTRLVADAQQLLHQVKQRQLQLRQQTELHQGLSRAELVERVKASIHQLSSILRKSEPDDSLFAFTAKEGLATVRTLLSVLQGDMASILREASIQFFSSATLVARTNSKKSRAQYRKFRKDFLALLDEAKVCRNDVNPGSLSASILSPRAQERNDRVKLRQSAVTELLRTESSYFQSLQELKTLFLDPMSERSDLFPEQVLTRIFCNLTVLLKITEDTLESFKATQSDLPAGANSTVGEVFLKMAPWLKHYALYVNNFDSSLQALQQIKSVSAASAFLKKQSRQSPQKLDLGSYLIMPVQRMPRYEMLLKEILRHSDGEDSDYRFLEQALETMQEINEQLNTLKRKEDTRARLEVIQTKLDLSEGSYGHMQLGSSLFKTERLYLRERLMDVVITRSKLNKASMARSSRNLIKADRVSYYCYLFDDALILAEPTAVEGIESSPQHVKYVIFFQKNKILLTQVSSDQLGGKKLRRTASSPLSKVFRTSKEKGSSGNVEHTKKVASKHQKNEKVQTPLEEYAWKMIVSPLHDDSSHNKAWTYVSEHNRC